MADTSRADRALPWVLRATWIGVLVAGAPAIDDATADWAGGADTMVSLALAGWIVGVCAMGLPAVISLTATRLVVPLAVPAAVVALVGGADAVSGAALLMTGLLATSVAFSANLGRVFVQASAYGDEDRHPLRAPAAYALAAVLSWALWAAAVIGAPLALADRRWVVGPLLVVATVAGGVLGWPRWHRLARRWFVVVPIGVVVHDPLVLAETLMLRRTEIASVHLAPSDTEAADLTGPASGHAIEITTREPATVIMAATPKHPRGTVIHLRACLVAPSRPGRALTAAAARRLPVG